MKNQLNTTEITIPVNRTVRNLIRRALREDLGTPGDITTQATIPEHQISSAQIIAKSSGIIAGQNVAKCVFTFLDKKLQYEVSAPDGDSVTPGTIIAQIRGRTSAILTGERTALNLLGRASGIATLTQQFVSAVVGTGAQICETRKTAPGLRFIDKAAVRTGGGVNHRYALHDAFLLKENHIKATGGITKAINACKLHKKNLKNSNLKIMVEVRNKDEFLEALSAEPDRIMMDNMTPEQIRNCIDKLEKVVELEATGGINLDNVREYAECGVNYISLGILTHSVKSLDLSLLIID